MKKLIGIFIILGTLSLQSSFSKVWNKIHSEDQIDIFSIKSSSGVLPFKAEGTIQASTEKVLNILKDHQSKHLWSPKLKGTKMHKKMEGERYIFSEYYSTPWPAYDREFLLEGRITKLKEGSIRLSAQSLNEQNLMDDDHVQADVKTLDIILKPLGENLTNISFEFHGDMKGWMPIWLINLIQKKWPLRFIQGLRKRVQEVQHP